MPNRVYPETINALWKDEFNVLTDTVRVIAVDVAAYTYNAAHNFLDDVPAGSRIDISDPLTGKTVIAGVFTADPLTMTSVPAGDDIGALIPYIDTGVEGTSRLLSYLDGTIIVTAAVAAGGGDTLVRIDPLAEPLPDNAVLTFTGGTVATLNGAAAAGARSLVVDALPGAIAVGATATGVIEDSGFPLPTDGGNVLVTWPVGGIASAVAG